MATQFETESQQSITELVSGIVQDAQKLARQQLTLFQVELKNDWRRTLNATIPLVCGLLVASIGVMVGAFAVAHLLPTIWPELPFWGALAIVGGGLLALGAAATLLGRILFSTFNPPPTETVQGLKENLQWKTNR